MSHSTELPTPITKARAMVVTNSQVLKSQAGQSMRRVMYDVRENNPFPAVDLILCSGCLVTHLRCLSSIGSAVGVGVWVVSHSDMMKSVGGMRGLKLRMRKAKIQSPAIRGQSSGVPLEGCVCVLYRACHQRTLEINQSSEIPCEKKCMQ